MKKKRPTPRQLPSGNWNCVVMVDGKRYSVTDEDKDICQAKAMAIQAGVMEKEEKKKALSLEKAIEEYIETKSNTLSPSTIRGYEQVKKNRFPGLMKRNIYTITKRDVQVAVNQEVKNASPKTIANAYGVVRPVLKEYGIDVFGVSLPKRSRPQKEYLQIEEIGTLLDAASGDSCEIEILLALWLGMRRSEILGLCWDCVDEENGTITVRRTMVPDKAHKMVLKDMAKNQSSNRTVSCPDYILNKLSDRRNGRTDGLVFSIHPDTLRKHIHALCAKCGVTDTSAHGLRHTNAAVMHKLNIDVQHAMRRNGWTEERTYKGLYSYAFDSVGAKADTKINAFYKSQINQKQKKSKITNEITNDNSEPLKTKG